MNSQKTNPYKYMGLGFQLIIIVFLFVFIGNLIDKHTKNENTIWLVIMSILGVFLCFYYLIKNVSKKK